MSYTERKPNEKIQYKYTLNKNYKSKEQTICLNGINFKKGMWNTFLESKHNELKTYICSYQNPEGIIDAYIFDPVKEIQMKELATQIKFVHRKKIYSPDSLAVMGRKELEEIAREYGIDPLNKVNTFLAKCILKEQTEYRRKLDTTENFFDETNKIVKEE